MILQPKTGEEVALVRDIGIGYTIKPKNKWQILLKMIYTFV